MYRVPAVTQLGGQRPPVRLYQTWKGNNIFILQGRLVFGPDVRSLFLTIGLIVVPMSIFCAFVARKLMDAFADHGGVAIMVVAVVFTLIDLTFLLLTCARDPGIIPRNAHPPEPDPSDGPTDLGGGQTLHSRLPRTKETRVNGIIVKIKYCDTCMLYRPPRCSHCSICNNCVENFDHHCPWVGQCIGLRNYRFFFMFILSTALLCSYVFALCWVDIKRTMDIEHRTIWKAMARTPASVALILYTFVPFFFVAGLSLFHTYLISTNQTTYENFRYQYDRRDNPYNRGFVNNFKEKFFSCIPPSKNDFRAKVVHEIGLSNRMTEGDFVSQTLGRPDGELEMGRKATWSEDSSGLMFNDLENEVQTESSGAKESGTCETSHNLTTS